MAEYKDFPHSAITIFLSSSQSMSISFFFFFPCGQGFQTPPDQDLFPPEHGQNNEHSFLSKPDFLAIRWMEKHVGTSPEFRLRVIPAPHKKINDSQRLFRFITFIFFWPYPSPPRFLSLCLPGSLSLLMFPNYSFARALYLYLSLYICLTVQAPAMPPSLPLSL